MMYPLVIILYNNTMAADAPGASRVLAAAQAVALLRRPLLSVVLLVGEGPEDAYHLPCRPFRSS